jgi:hypothetical protein
MSVITTPSLTQRARQKALEEMVADFSLDVARAIVRSMADETGMSCEKVADTIIQAWERSKERHPEEVEQDILCFEKIIMYP